MHTCTSTLGCNSIDVYSFLSMYMQMDAHLHTHIYTLMSTRVCMCVCVYVCVCSNLWSVSWKRRLRQEMLRFWLFFCVVTITIHVLTGNILWLFMVFWFLLYISSRSYSANIAQHMIFEIQVYERECVCVCLCVCVCVCVH